MWVGKNWLQTDRCSHLRICVQRVDQGNGPTQNSKGLFRLHSLIHSPKGWSLLIKFDYEFGLKRLPSFDCTNKAICTQKTYSEWCPSINTSRLMQECNSNKRRKKEMIIFNNLHCFGHNTSVNDSQANG